MSVTLYVVLFVICVILSAFFSSSETAFTSLEHYRVDNLVENKVKGAKTVQKLKENPDRFLSTILLGNNLVNTASAAIATTLATIWFGDSGVALATGVVTFILLIFAETVPKTIANGHREKLALIYAPVVNFLMVILSPFVTIVSWISRLFCKLFKVDSTGSNIVKEEDIQSLINAGEKDGAVEEDQAEILNNVLEFDERPISDVLVPRLEVVGVPVNATVDEFFDIYMKHPLSQYPVYDDTLDNIKGVLSIKDMLLGISKDDVNRQTLISDVMKPANFVPENKNAGDLFNEMREGASHMAIVVDEYGATAGIVTINDLVEEILGPLGEEFLKVEKDIELINSNTYQCDATMRIDEINNELDIDIPEGDYDTIAGFILYILGHFPKQGQIIKYKGLKIIVTVMNGLKIEEVQIIKEQLPNEQSTN